MYVRVKGTKEKRTETKGNGGDRVPTLTKKKCLTHFLAKSVVR